MTFPDLHALTLHRTTLLKMLLIRRATMRILLVLCFVQAVLCHCLSQATLPAGFAEMLLAEHLDPTAMAITPDGRLFILEKSGRVLIVEQGELLTHPFLVLEVDNLNERGLSGIAVDPDFEENGYIYLYYTVKDANHNRISRFTAHGNHTVPGSEMVLLDLDPLPGTIHNAGAMVFGIDGKLYVSVGDGSGADLAQSMTSLHGKILRLNPDGSIPEDNPFYHLATGRHRAIYALGLRNAFTMAVQPGTGRIFANDVGAATWEEVNEILPGMNYGWPMIEGPIAGQNPPPNYMDPVYAYHHSQGCAIVGAAFYNPETLLFPPEYEGMFFFADYCRSYIRYIDPDSPQMPSQFATAINRPVNLLTAPDGTLYYLARAGLGGGSVEDNTASTDGTLWRIFYLGPDAPPFIAVHPASVLVPAGEDARFLTSAAGAEPLTYQWQIDGVDIPDATSDVLLLHQVMLSDSGSVIRCIIENPAGRDTTREAVLRVTSNQRPVAFIAEPHEGAVYRAGETLVFSGSAEDPEEGELPSAAMRWLIDFHHDDHTHPALAPTSGISTGEYPIPQNDELSENVWYRIYLTATDSAGLSHTVIRDVLPLKTQFHVHSDPQGLPVFVENTLLETPVTMTSVVGVIRTIAAVSPMYGDDTVRIFDQWSDGLNSALRSFPADDDTITYTARYADIAAGKGTGLIGYYYNGVPFDPTFYEPYAFTRLDPVIDFNWGGGSPSSELLGDDFFLVRWEGYVEPFIDDDFTFHVIADDGIRLWVNDTLLIDKWINQPPTEWTGNITLEGGVQYPIKIEYYESAGGAVCRLFWSSGRMTRHIVPQSQLYPEKSVAVNDPERIVIRAYPNPVSQVLNIDFFSANEGIIQARIINTLGQVVHISSAMKSQHPATIAFDLHHLSHGMYWLQLLTESGRFAVLEFVKL